MPTIHPTSIIDPGAELADDVVVGPFCHVGANVTLGPGTELASHVTVFGRTTMGARNKVAPYAFVGAEPQDLKYHGEDSVLCIGDDNDIREYVSIHRGTEHGGGETRIGDKNLLMAYTHVGHDSIIGSHCVIANAVQIAGHVVLEDNANIGGASALHHFVTVSRFAFVGGMTRVVADVPPFMVVEGNPARVRKVNTVLLKRMNFEQQHIDHLKTAFRRLYGNGEFTGGLQRNLDALEQEFGDDWAVRTLIDTARRSAHGVYGRHREASRHDNRYTNPVR